MVGIAIITMIIIVYSTIRYTSNQQNIFKDNVHSKDFMEMELTFFGTEDSLALSQFEGKPFLIHFWSTWSGMSIEMNHLIQDLADETGIEVIAAVVRDDPGQVSKYLEEYPNDFHIVSGTELFYDLEATGVPSQIFFDDSGSVYFVQIGRDEQKVKETIYYITGVTK